MGIQERKQKEKEQRRESIINAAESCIMRDGIENTTMDDIAREAELSKGTLYLYFSSKEELFFAITARIDGILEQKIEENLNPTQNGREKLDIIISMLREFFLENQHYMSIMTGSIKYILSIINEENLEILKEMDDKVIQYIQNAVTEGVKDGSLNIRMDPFRFALTSYLMLMSSYIFLIQFSPLMEKAYQLSDEDLISDMVQLLFRDRYSDRDST